MLTFELTVICEAPFNAMVPSFSKSAMRRKLEPSSKVPTAWNWKGRFELSVLLLATWRSMPGPVVRDAPTPLALKSVATPAPSLTSSMPEPFQTAAPLMSIVDAPVCTGGLIVLVPVRARVVGRNLPEPETVAPCRSILPTISAFAPRRVVLFCKMRLAAPLVAVSFEFAPRVTGPVAVSVEKRPKFALLLMIGPAVLTFTVIPGEFATVVPVSSVIPEPRVKRGLTPLPVSKTVLKTSAVPN